VLNAIDQEKERIKEILCDLENYFSTKITDRQKELYIEDLIEMGSVLTYEAALKYRRDWNSSTFPLPGILRKQVFFHKNTINDEAGTGWHLLKK
jgi:hypothetical protein